jgi:serine protease AprX
MTRKVFVEMSVPAGFAMDSLMSTEAAALPGLTLDTEYQPILVPAVADQPATFAAAKQETVLVRGELDETQEAALRSAPNVVEIWTDGQIAAFGDCGCQELESGLGLPSSNAMGGDLFTAGSMDEQVRLPFSLETASPCPPTDCDAGTAKGTIEDEARFLSCDRLWSKGIRGAGVVIGNCDTGVDKTKIPAVIGGRSPNPTYLPGTDPGGHGSMCTTDALGMCPEAKIYDIGILKSTGGMTGLLSDAIAAFQWALIQHRTNRTTQILSNSWGMFQQS